MKMSADPKVRSWWFFVKLVVVFVILESTRLLPVLFLAFVFISFAFGQNLAYEVSIRPIRETHDNTIYWVEVTVENISLDRIARNGVTVNFPLNEQARVHRNEARPYGVYGAFGKIPYLVIDGNLVLTNDPEVFTLTNNVWLAPSTQGEISEDGHPNSTKLALQYVVEASYATSFPTEIREGITVHLASPETISARLEAESVEQENRLAEVARLSPIALQAEIRTKRAQADLAMEARTNWYKEVRELHGTSKEELGKEASEGPIQEGAEEFRKSQGSLSIKVRATTPWGEVIVGFIIGFIVLLAVVFLVIFNVRLLQRKQYLLNIWKQNSTRHQNASTTPTAKDA
jgi:hypothetical protein